jgi:hypothetical protein
MVSRNDGPPKRNDHAQDGRTLIATGDQYPAILPWSLCFGWHPSFRAYTGTLPCPAAGLLLDLLSMILSEKGVSTLRIALLRMIVSENSESGFRKIMRKRAQ